MLWQVIQRSCLFVVTIFVLLVQLTFRLVSLIYNHLIVQPILALLNSLYALLHPSPSPASLGFVVGASAASVLYQYPSLIGSRHSRHTLVLDLDETLVHSSSQYALLTGHDLRLEIVHKTGTKVFYVKKRPHVNVFLDVLSRYYEIVIFTASMRRYADPVVDMLDLNRVISRRYFRESCLRSGDKFVKNLNHVSSHLNTTVMIDNSLEAFNLNPENGILIRPFFNDKDDSELLQCIPFLIALRCLPDVRPILARRVSIR